MRSIGFATALSVTAFLTTATPAQLEPGWGVYTRLFNTANATSSAIPGGIVIYHPYLGLNVDVTNLPAALLGTGPWGGANAVLVRDDDGSLLAAAVYRDVPAEIYDITLDGTVATVRRTYQIGGAVPFSSIDQMAWLPGNRVLFSHISVDNPALEPQGLGILDLATGDVTAVPIASFPAGRTINCCAVDPTFTTVYFGTYAGGGGVYTVPLAGGAAVAVPGYETMNSAAQQLAVDHLGTLFIAPGSNIGALLQVDPATGDTVRVAEVGGTVNGLCIEPVTGDYLFMRINAGAGISTQFYWNAAELRVEVPGMDGYESPSGIAMRSSLLPFGAAHRRSSQEWQIRPNPGGAPRAGNLDFSLTTTSPQRSLGVMWFALCPARRPFNTWLTRNVLLNPWTVVGFARLVPPSTSFTVDLPLPACRGTVDLYAQVFTMAHGMPLVGSEGLRIHIYD